VVADPASKSAARAVNVDDDPGVVITLDRLEILPGIGCAGLSVWAWRFIGDCRRAREQSRTKKECPDPHEGRLGQGRGHDNGCSCPTPSAFNPAMPWRGRCLRGRGRI